MPRRRSGPSGRRQDVRVDALGLIVKVVAHAVDLAVYQGLRLVLERIRGRFGRPRRVGGDEMYGRTADRVSRRRPGLPIDLQVEERTRLGYEALPRRGVAERTLARLDRCRRLDRRLRGAGGR